MGHYRYRQRPSRRLLYSIAAISVSLAVLGLSLLLVYVRASTKKTIADESKPAVIAKGLSSRMMFVGDVNWARETQRRAEKSGRGYDYITSGLMAAQRTRYDAWIGNFECPVTDRDVPYQQQVDSLKFNCRPEYLPALARYFTAATLANNHMDNNGGQLGLKQTRDNLRKNNIQYFGTYDMNDTDQICNVIAMPAKTTDNKPTVLPVAMCGYMYVVDVAPSDEQLEVMRAYAKVMPVIAMPHMGIEYRTTAEDAKVNAYHRMIDSGADAVIGAHPHVIQNSESYKGRLIAYSEGNFLFDQQSVSPETNLGLSVSLKLTVQAGATADAYQKIGPSCASFEDDCLARLRKSISKRPEIGVHYDFGCYSIASDIPVAGTDTQCDAAMQAATIDRLGDLSKRW